jgi:hypothetical protein
MGVAQWELHFFLFWGAAHCALRSVQLAPPFPKDFALIGVAVGLLVGVASCQHSVLLYCCYLRANRLVLLLLHLLLLLSAIYIYVI